MIAYSAREVELLRLARLLGAERGDLTFLEGAEPDLLATLHDAVAAHLRARNAVDFERVATIGRLVPPRLAAALAEHALGPVLAARMAAVFDADRVGDVAKWLSPRFLAEIAPLVDPSSVGDLISSLSPAKLLVAARELMGRQEWMTLAAYIDGTPADRLAETINLFEGEVLLRVGLLMANRDALVGIVELLSDERLRELLVAAADTELFGAALGLLSAVDEPCLIRIGGLLGDLDEGRLTALAAELSADGELRAIAQPLIERSPSPVALAVERAAARGAR